ncbi:MAG TPA: 1-deoxy-D-xylulose-5-phosphate reductoisomerase [Candidatus Acidoferrales bacterium]|nr:1-deoxy-D-xylulose-5-phosphate reductoisomerase [Candidatus Acidoferrales bacterium]
MSPDAASRELAVLGSTGSIGTQALEVAEREPGRLRVAALAAGRDRAALAAQAARWRPAWIGLERADDPEGARAELAHASPGAHVEIGPGAAERVAGGCGAALVVNGIVGAAGLAPSLAALRRGARLALANKETLVVGGALVERELRRAGGELVPVDSEHSAALQCLLGRPPAEVARLTLTASGGPLRHHPDWRRATRDEVLAHPVWAMGPRITTDSATLFNKGLEVIEAHWLFGLGWDQIDAVIHPQAVVHALATFRDGSLLAQLARADMRLPIQLALSWPERWGPATPALAATDLAGLTFEPIDPARHPAYACALAAGHAGGTAPCALNAADEVAVQAFLDGAVTLGQVPELIARVLERHRPEPVESLEQLRSVDAWAREAVRAAVAHA